MSSAGRLGRRIVAGAHVAGLAMLATAAAGCAYVHDYHHHDGKAPPAHAQVYQPGPPPHAPAHGYRHKHHGGVELVFDAGLGVYVVVGHAGHYHDGDRYYRWKDGGWSVSVRLDGGWSRVAAHDVPPGLRAKHAKGKPKPRRGPPAKHGY